MIYTKNKINKFFISIIFLFLQGISMLAANAHGYSFKLFVLNKTTQNKLCATIESPLLGDTSDPVFWKPTRPILVLPDLNFSESSFDEINKKCISSKFSITEADTQNPVSEFTCEIRLTPERTGSDNLNPLDVKIIDKEGVSQQLTYFYDPSSQIISALIVLREKSIDCNDFAQLLSSIDESEKTKVKLEDSVGEECKWNYDDYYIWFGNIVMTTGLVSSLAVLHGIIFN